MKDGRTDRQTDGYTAVAHTALAWLGAFKNVAAERLRTRWTFSQSLMVSVGRRVKIVNTGLIFIDSGVKVNEAYY